MGKITDSQTYVQADDYLQGIAIVTAQKQLEQKGHYRSLRQIDQLFTITNPVLIPNGEGVTIRRAGVGSWIFDLL